MAKSNEPILWSLFSAGGVVAALCVPVHIVLFGLLIPMGMVEPASYQGLLDILLHPVTKLYWFVLVSLPLFHWAHRFKFTLVDIGLKQLELLISVVCYGAAILGTGYAAVVLWSV